MEYVNKETLATISSITGVVFSAIAGVVYKKKRQTKKLKTVEEDNITKILSSLKTVISRIDQIEITTKSIKEHIETEEFINRIRREIKRETSEFIRAHGLNKEEDEPFVTLVLQGRDVSITFATDCIYSGLKNLNVDDIELSISSVFDGLRLLAERYIDKDFIPNLKNNSRIYDHIDHFKSGLKDIAAGMYNGKTNDKFIRVVIDFITNVYIDGLRTYRKL